MAYDDKDFRHYPFYVARDCSTNRESYTIKLSKPIRDELDKYFDERYGKGNKQKGLHDMVLHYLNTKCLKHSYFNFDYYIFTKNDRNITQDDFLFVGYLDNNELVKELSTRNEFQQPLYLQNHKKIQIDGIKKVTLIDKFASDDLYFKHFTSNCGELGETSDEFLNVIDEWKASDNVFDIYEFKFTLNNFLDNKTNGEYRSNFAGNMPIHHGIGLFKDAEMKTYYYHYKWIYNSHDNFKNDINLFDFKIIDETDFMDLVQFCDYKKLKIFAGISTLDDPDELDAEIEHVKKKISTWQQHLQELELLKEYNDASDE